MSSLMPIAIRLRRSSRTQRSLVFYSLFSVLEGPCGRHIGTNATRHGVAPPPEQACPFGDKLTALELGQAEAGAEQFAAAAQARTGHPRIECVLEQRSGIARLAQ